MDSARFTVRPASTFLDAEKILRLLVQMEREARGVGAGLVDAIDSQPDKGFAELLRVVEEGAAFVVEDTETGLVVGSLGLWLRNGFWFAPDAEHFAELWFYVIAPLRNGAPTELLLGEAAGLAEATGIPVYVNVFDPQKAARRLRGGPMEIGRKLGYIPFGRICRIAPTRAAEAVSDEVGA